jgi:hypothetical protein
MSALLDVGMAAASKLAVFRVCCKINVRANILGLQKTGVNLKSA